MRIGVPSVNVDPRENLQSCLLVVAEPLGGSRATGVVRKHHMIAPIDGKLTHHEPLGVRGEGIGLGHEANVGHSEV